MTVRGDQSKKVTVVVPTYNQAQYLPTALDSILEQTHEDWEAIVVNDGSTDGTADIIEDYARRDGRFIAIHQANGGISSALNRGLSEATGDYFCWLSSDDFFLSEKLAAQTAAFDRIRNAGIVVSGFNHVDPDGRIINTVKSTPEAEQTPEANLILHGNFINGCTVMIPMRVIREVGGFSTRYRYAQDYDMWTRVALHYRIVWLPEVLVSYRVHPGQGSATQEIDCLIDSLVIIHEIMQDYSLRQVSHMPYGNPREVDRLIQYIVNAVGWQFSWINFPQVNGDFWNWVASSLMAKVPAGDVERILASVGQFMYQHVRHRHVETNLKSIEDVLRRLPSLVPFSPRTPPRAPARESRTLGTSGSPRVAFAVNARALEPSGWDTVVRYSNWLVALGVQVCVYSDSSVPAEVRLEARSSVVADAEERFRSITEPLVVVSALSEVPLALNNISGHGRLLHLCLRGESLFRSGGLRDARTPEAQIEYLCRLPVERIVTSEALRQFFLEKNREDSYLVSEDVENSADQRTMTDRFAQFVPVFEEILQTKFDSNQVARISAGLNTDN